MDNTTIHPLCASQVHHIDLHLWRGAPQNLDENRPVQILVNHGYVVGFCPDRLQPVWSAYRVAHADDDVDYDRPLSYYDDMRLDDEYRIGRKTFGKIDGIQLNVGHMSPNEVINRQFGRLAQMETFLMSNMSPQYASLNSGVWLKLETAIREIRDEPGKDHVWAIVGPVFGNEPASINRGQGKSLPIPDAYFCVIVDPQSYPFDTLSRVHLDCFIIPQDASRDSNPDEYRTTQADVEKATNLKFFASWGREMPLSSSKQGEPRSESRLMRILEQKRTESEPVEPVQPTNFITYKIIADMDNKLKTSARTACNFWNRFVQPTNSIVIRLGTFTQSSSTIARAYMPYENEGILYGRVEFNTMFLSKFTVDEIVGTIIHEIGHSLGIGWKEWDKLFDHDTGKFKAHAVSRLNKLDEMEVELDGGFGTALAHWDEDKFDKELMTGFQDHGEYVLPVTIDLMTVLGHRVSERLGLKTDLAVLIQDVAGMFFSRQDDARTLDLEHFEETKLFENIPHGR